MHLTRWPLLLLLTLLCGACVTDRAASLVKQQVPSVDGELCVPTEATCRTSSGAQIRACNRGGESCRYEVASGPSFSCDDGCSCAEAARRTLSSCEENLP